MAGIVAVLQAIHNRFRNPQSNPLDPVTETYSVRR